MKRAMRTEFDSNNNSGGGELPPRSPGGLPPKSPTKESAQSLEEPAIPQFETSVIDPKADDSSEVLSELLRSDVPDAKTAEPADPSLELQVDSPPSSVEDDSALPRTAASQELDPSPNTRDAAAANYASIPAKLETSNNEAWRDVISPMKDTPSKEWSHLSSRITPKKDSTMDISDETSETGRTRSTISYDSDDSSSGGRGSSHKQIRSRSVGRGRRYGRTKAAALRSSNSHSPSSRRRPFAEGTSSCQLFDRARESRIRRLQQLRKGYMPLENDRAESPEPRHRSRDPYEDPLSDPELTPKRKTATVLEPTNKLLGSTETSPSAIPETLYQPSLLESDDNEPCPEFDNILDDLDLQLIDLNRPIGAEYGAEEGSM